MPMPTTVPFDALCSHCGRDLPEGSMAVYVRGTGTGHPACSVGLVEAPEVPTPAPVVPAPTPAPSAPTVRRTLVLPFDTMCAGCMEALPQDTQAVFVPGQGLHHEGCVPAPVA